MLKTLRSKRWKQKTRTRLEEIIKDFIPEIELFLMHGNGGFKISGRRCTTSNLDADVFDLSTYVMSVCLSVKARDCMHMWLSVREEECSRTLSHMTFHYG